ncbi:hypothetical protein AB0N31_31895 [Streptomyces sp. NPDC051051]
MGAPTTLIGRVGRNPGGASRAGRQLHGHQHRVVARVAAVRPGNQVGRL